MDAPASSQRPEDAIMDLQVGMGAAIVSRSDGRCWTIDQDVAKSGSLVQDRSEVRVVILKPGSQTFRM